MRRRQWLLSPSSTNLHGEELYYWTMGRVVVWSLYAWPPLVEFDGRSIDRRSIPSMHPTFYGRFQYYSHPLYKYYCYCCLVAFYYTIHIWTLLHGNGPCDTCTLQLAWTRGCCLFCLWNMKCVLRMSYICHIHVTLLSKPLC